jgi:(1->4)-alpha-D-glucan 1-alpha-D-glucosylmutase
MLALSTHDTKRSEDVRARLAVLSELPAEWAEAVRAWRGLAAAYRVALVDGATEYLIWQTLVGTWGADGPIGADRLLPYLQKAVREAKRHTTWTSPDADYEDAVRAFALGVLADADVLAAVSGFCAERVDAPSRVGVLGQKLVQLTMPGVPDVYQGTELVDLSLVDPDNRRPVSFAERRERLARLDGGARPVDLSDEKLLVTAAGLRLRREHPEWFVGEDAVYVPLPTSTGNAVAFARGSVSDGPQVVTLATRLPVSLARLGGWREHNVALPDGAWRDLLTGRDVGAGPTALADVLNDLPVALLVRR